MKKRLVFSEKWWDLLPYLPVGWLFFQKRGPSFFDGLPAVLTVLSFSVVLFCFQKSLETLHFGSRKWPRGLFALLAVGLCPSLWVALFRLEIGHFRVLAFSAVLLFFSLRFLEDEFVETASAILAAVVALASVWLGLPISEGVWLVVAVVFWRLFRLKNWSAVVVFLSLLALGGWFFFEKWTLVRLSQADWSWSRFEPILLPILPRFWWFSAVLLCFFKKTDRLPLPKAALLGSIFLNIFMEIATPQPFIGRLEMAFFALSILTFPVFERGLLYGLVFIKKWKIWLLVALLFAIQIGLIFYPCSNK